MRSITGLIGVISFSPWKSFFTFRAVDNCCCHYDHYVNVCKKKTLRGKKHVSKSFQTAKAQKRQT